MSPVSLADLATQFLPGIRDREMNHQRAPPCLTNRRLCRWNKRLAAQRGYVTTNRSPECRCSQITCYPSAGFPKMKTIKLGTCSFVIGVPVLDGDKMKCCPNLTPDDPRLAGAPDLPPLPKTNSAHPGGAPCKRRFLSGEMV